MSDEYELFKIATRTWRVVTHRDYSNPGIPAQRLSLATTDDEFTADAKVTLEYYSDYFTIDPVAAKDQYVTECMAFAKCIQDNDTDFIEPEHWYVRQLDKQEGRLFMHRFTGVPLPYFYKLWRRPLVPQNINIELVDKFGASVYFSYFEENDPLMTMHFECYLDWDGLFDAIKYKHKRKPHQWWRKHMVGGLYLFSDYDTVFENEDDELAYMVDFSK